MIIDTFPVGQLQTNCYVVADEATCECAILDPGGDVERILDATVGLQVRYVVNTHAHFDHMYGNAEVIRRLSARQADPPRLVAHPDARLLLVAGGGAGWFGLSPASSPPPDLCMRDGDELAVGGIVFQVMHTPGHSADSISLYSASEGVVFVGDVLFSQGVGRYDLPGGDWDTLVRSIRERLYALPDETMVYPGHGPPTTIGREKRANPWVAWR